MDKVYPNATAAIADLKSGAVIMSGGFGLCGNPEACIKAIAGPDVSPGADATAPQSVSAVS